MLVSGFSKQRDLHCRRAHQLLVAWNPPAIAVGLPASVFQIRYVEWSAPDRFPPEPHRSAKATLADFFLFHQSVLYATDVIELSGLKLSSANMGKKGSAFCVATGVPH